MSYQLKNQKRAESVQALVKPLQTYPFIPPSPAQELPLHFSESQSLEPESEQAHYS